MAKLLDYSSILLTILLTAYGQLILKWRLGAVGELPQDMLDKVRTLVILVFDPYIFSGLAAAFLASLAWMAALSRFELNHAYPFMSLNFVLVILLSTWLLGEPLSPMRAIGVTLIVAGTIVASQG